MGTWGLGDMVQKTYTPLGLDMGTRGLGDMGTWGLGDMAQKTYAPLGLDMRTWGLGDMVQMGFRGKWGLGGMFPQSLIKSHQLKFTMFLNVSPEKPGEACPTRIERICYTCYIRGFTTILSSLL